MCFNWKEHSTLSEFNMVITPYVPNVIDVKNPEETFGRYASPDLQSRPTLIYFSGRCTPNHDHYYGKLLRCAQIVMHAVLAHCCNRAECPCPFRACTHTETDLSAQH